jgi:hypothetical protein
VQLAGILGISTVVCPAATVCYAIGANNAGYPLLRSHDSGKTWSGSGLKPPKQLQAIACPGKNTCFGTAWTCPSGCWGIFRTTDGATSWKKVADSPAGHLPGALACPSVTTCYALAASRSNAYYTSVAGTTNGGTTWTGHHLPDSASDIMCSSQTTCFLNTGFTVLLTQDGFRHTRETLAHMVLHNLTLTDISCPSTTACYAASLGHVCAENAGSATRSRLPAR